MAHGILERRRQGPWRNVTSRARAPVCVLEYVWDKVAAAARHYQIDL